MAPAAPPIPAPTAAPAPAPAPAPMSVPHPDTTMASMDSPTTGVSSFFIAPSSRACRNCKRRTSEHDAREDDAASRGRTAQTGGVFSPGAASAETQIEPAVRRDRDALVRTRDDGGHRRLEHRRPLALPAGRQLVDAEHGDVDPLTEPDAAAGRRR